MNDLLIVGEDALCCSLGERIVGEAMPGWRVHGQPFSTGGVTKLWAALPRYVEQARHVRPVVCIADTDNGCPVDLKVQHLPPGSPPGFFLRLAVPEAECWVLADRMAVASYLQISAQSIANAPEQLADAKQEVLRLAKKSKVRQFREEMVSGGNPLKQGAGYNVHLRGLVRSAWSPGRAAENSPSLQRTMAKLRTFAEQQD